MLPFLASSVRVVKSDGSTVEINGDSSSEKSDGDHAEEGAQTKSYSGTTSSHRHRTSSSDAWSDVVPVVAIVFTFLWLIVKAVMSPFHNRNRNPPPGQSSRWWRGTGTWGRTAEAPANGPGLTDEEQALLRKLQKTLVQMESRIESLETILIDQSRTKENYGTKH